MANENARQRRIQKTISEGLLWSLLRGRQLGGLKFRREHPIDCWIADFACVSRKLVVEIDGDYHDENTEKDLKRQRDLEHLGWKVIRFTAQDVELDAEAVSRAIATEAGVEYEFTARKKTGSGKFSFRAKSPKAK
ncbi:MAG: endonuclease domain-containing protein [Pirellulaceae bacterium]